MKIDLTGRIAVITGGSSGIGLACAKLFLEAGAKVAICGRNEEKLSSTSNMLDKSFPGDRVLSQRCDVLDKIQVEAFGTVVQEQFGGVDMLINNAGQARLSTFTETSDTDWREELELKFFSVINPSRVFLPYLENSDFPAIVCTSSLISRQPEPHLVATSSARAGQLAMVYSMAQEFAVKGIRVNSVLIGQVESAQWRKRYEALANENLNWEAYTVSIAEKAGVPLGRMGKPEEAAAAIFFLATPMSSFTTGSTVDVSGGLSRHVG